MHGLELDSNLKLSISTREDRALKKNNVRVRVTSCGICGTDNHIINGESRVTLPVILGHEFGGIVEEIGSEVRALRSGDFVAINPNIPCGSCEYCQEGKIHLCKNLIAIGVDVDGGMSDHCVVPESQVYKLPSSFNLSNLPFVEPLSCVLHGLDRIDVKHGEKVLIIGAGTIGLMFIMLIREIAGELYVDETVPARLERAITVGGTGNSIDKSEYFDAVLECSGTIAGLEKAIRSAKRGGRILIFGVTPKGSSISLYPNEVYNKELAILGSYVNPHTFPRSIDLIANKKIYLSELKLKTFALKNYVEAFEASRSGMYSKVAFIFEDVD